MTGTAPGGGDTTPGDDPDPAAALCGRPLVVALDATPLYGPRTGIGRFVAEVLAGVAARPGEVAPLAYAVTFRGREQLADLVPAGVATATRPMAAAPLRALWRRTDLPRIEAWTGPIDVVHGTNFVVPPARAARVVTVHDLTFLHHPEMCTPDVLQYRGLVERALEGGAWVHTVSSFVRDEVVELLGAPPGRVVAVPNGVTPTRGGDPARGRATAGSDRYVLALGTIEPRKGFPTLVAAFDRLAGTDRALRLVVAGPDGWGLDAFESACRRSAHAERVVRTGFVGEQERADLLAGASVVAVPSLYEGFGLPAAEALSAGVPVVASEAGGLPEVVGDAGLLVPPGDEVALADALGRVLGDPELADRLAAAGPGRAGRFTWDATTAGLVDLWRRAHAARRSA
ncbi:MAG: glycosyltransferase family 4 protein [Acidimicrobiia bacterium]